MDMNSLVFIGLAMLAAGGVFYAVVYPYLSGEARAEKSPSRRRKMAAP